MARGTMRQKFEKKKKEEAKAWLLENGFNYPYSEVKNLENIPKYVSFYLKQIKSKNKDLELGEE